MIKLALVARKKKQRACALFFCCKKGGVCVIIWGEGIMDNKQNERLVFNIAVLTTSIVVLLIIIACSMLAIAYPLDWANIIFSLGLKNASLISYSAHYEKTKDIDDLYLLIGKSIMAKNNEYQIKYIPELFEKEDYGFFVNQVENKNIASSYSRQATLYVANETEYLKGKYVVALYESGMKAQGLSYAINDLKETNIDKLSDKLSFVLGYYVNNMNATEYGDVAVYVNEIYEYYNEIKAVYDNYDVTSEEGGEVAKFYLALQAKQLIDISNVLIKLDGLNNTQTYSVQELTSAKKDYSATVNYYCFRNKGA